MPQLLKDSNRTPRGLALHFYVYLRLNFEKYTQDENAIKEFKKLLKKR